MLLLRRLFLRVSTRLRAILRLSHTMRLKRFHTAACRKE